MNKTTTDLLTLLEPDPSLAHPDPLSVQLASHGMQNTERNDIDPTHEQTNKLIGASSGGQEDVFANRTDLIHATKSRSPVKQSQLMKDEVVQHQKNNDIISVNGSEELERQKPGVVQETKLGPETKQLSMYEEFKDFNLSDEDSVDHTGVSASDSNGLTTNNATVNEIKEGHGERTSQSLEISEDEPLASNINPNLATHQDVSSISINKSDLNLMESKNQLNPADNLTSQMAPTTEISILDSSPGDFPFPGLSADSPLNIPPEWSDCPRATERIQLCQDTSLRVTLLKVWKPDALGLVFSVTNPNPKETVTGVNIKLDISSNLKVSQKITTFTE